MDLDKTEKFNTVAELLTAQIAVCSKSQKDIADEMGFSKPNIITMFKKGHTKLPIDRVPEMADAIGLDKGRLMRLALREYFPGMLDAMEDCLAPMVTRNERKLLKVWRESTEGQDPDIDKAQEESLKAGFAQFK
jgi:hypothetical protein